ncbi:hypothetical protein AOX55_00002260 [Sinorhizobium fredii CCBAU 25509]|nr:hypothetical protein AOX55_00002260 [Sinorhizobium fredii CCBAU 25509]
MPGRFLVPSGMLFAFSTPELGATERATCALDSGGGSPAVHVAVDLP